MVIILSSHSLSELSKKTEVVIRFVRTREKVVY
jgi:hypothetical protein